MTFKKEIDKALCGTNFGAAHIASFLADRDMPITTGAVIRWLSGENEPRWSHGQVALEEIRRRKDEVTAVIK